MKRAGSPSLSVAEIMRRRLAREAAQRPLAAPDDDPRLAFHERRLFALQARRAALLDEERAIDDQLDALPFGGGVIRDRLRSALRHRVSRIPAEINKVDEMIEQVRSDIERHKSWQLGLTNRSRD